MSSNPSNPTGGDPADLGGSSLDNGRFETIPGELAEHEGERKERLRRETEEAEAARNERPPKAAG